MTALLMRALVAAEEAGKAILDVYESDFAVEHKDDKSPLTLADKRSHELIVKELNNLPLRYPILSEEGRDISYEDRKNWEYFWLVDPLDGTREFVNRNGEFTVNIALIHLNRPFLGIVHVPVKGVFYFAARGTGAYRFNTVSMPDSRLMREGRNDGELFAEVLKHSARLPLKEQKSEFTIVCSRSHMSKDTEEFVNKQREKYGRIGFISSGSSLKFCLVSEGKADVYPRFAPTMEWDTAAGQVLVEEAGGEVLNFETSAPLKYNKENLLNPWFIARTTAG